AGRAEDLRAVPDAAHPPGAAWVARAVAARELFRKYDGVGGAVLESGRDACPAVERRLQARPIVAGRQNRWLAKDLEIPRVGRVSRTPINAIAQAGVAWALINGDERLPQEGIVRDVHRVPGRPDDADVDRGGRVRGRSANVGAPIQPDGHLPDIVLFDV